MSEVNERSRLLPDAAASRQHSVDSSTWPPSAVSSSDLKSADAHNPIHGAALRRHSSASLHPAYHQHRSSTKHWQHPTDGDLEPSKISIYTVVPVLLLGVFVSNADGSLVIASSQSIASEFQQLSQASWIVTSYVLAQVACQPLYGKLSDIFGRKRNLITAYTFFTVGCLLCGIGNAFWVLIAGRAISGIGGAGMTAIVSIIIADLVPVRNIAMWRSFVNVAATVGRALGGPVGGILTDTIGWRWSFFGQCPLTALGLLLIIWKLPNRTGPISPLDEDEKLTEKMKRIDFAGAFLLAIAIGSFMVFLDFLPRQLSWNFTLIPALCSLLSGIMFCVIEGKWAREPILPLGLITKRDALTPYGIAGAQNAAQFAAFYGTSIYFQVVGGTSVSQAGLRLIPAVAGNAIGSLISGVLISKTGRYKLLTVIASWISSTGYLLMKLRWRRKMKWFEMIYLFFGGTGTGIVQSTTFIHLAASLPTEDIAIAGTTLYLAQNLFLLIGTQVGTTLLRTRLLDDLETALADDDRKAKIIKDAISSVTSIRHLPSSVKYTVIGAYVNGLSWTFGLSLGFGITGLLLGLTLIERRL